VLDHGVKRVFKMAVLGTSLCPVGLVRMGTFSSLAGA
jgi:hypothetical protein